MGTFPQNESGADARGAIMCSARDMQPVQRRNQIGSLPEA
jgi:hypothetical protein